MLGFVSFLVCSLLFFNAGFIKSDYLGHHCPNEALYDSNSSSGKSYRTNLDFLLSVLTANASRPSGFYNFSTGTATDPPNNTTVYGLFLCRGDVGTGECQSCVKTAGSEVLRFCPDSKAAAIWYEKCMLRYANRSIFSTLDSGGFNISLPNWENATKPDVFGPALRETLKQVMEGATTDDGSRKKFAVREMQVSSDKRIYALGQCTPDISSSDCGTCLGSLVRSIPSYYPLGENVLALSCNIRYELQPFYNVSNYPPSPQLPLSPSLAPATSEVETARKSRTPVGVTVAIPSTVVSCIMLFIVYFIFRKRRSMKKRRAKRRVDEFDDIIIDPESLQYSLSEIEIATNSFSAVNKIGQGGFGAVYKGKLPNGQDIAVKRLSQSSGQGAAEFKNEIAVVAKLQHKNLVRLLGFCLEEEEKILVYEFVPRRSLDYYLFDPEKQKLLNWSRRRSIIGGIARGLLYLHEDSRLKIVHRDLKASNILLDESMNPKIADFGMAKICGIDESEGNTTRIAGTFGYMAPEYTRRGLYSVKSDVFSFGVVILEIITGKKNNSFYHPENPEDLLSYAWSQWMAGTPLALLDPTVGQPYDENDVMKCIHIGFLCIEEDASKRPNMASLVSMLSTTSVSLPTIHHPAVLKDFRPKNVSLQDSNSDQANVQLLTGSINEASITVPYPR